MTLAQEPLFRPKKPHIKKIAYNVDMYNLDRVERSVKDLTKKFRDVDSKEKKEDILRMIKQAGLIAMSKARNKKKYKRKDREKYFKISNIYKALRRDLQNELKREG